MLATSHREHTAQVTVNKEQPLTLHSTAPGYISSPDQWCCPATARRRNLCQPCFPAKRKEINTQWSNTMARWQKSMLLEDNIPYKTWPRWSDSQSNSHKALDRKCKNTSHVSRWNSTKLNDLKTLGNARSPSNFSASVVSCSMVRPLLVVEENCQLSTSATWSQVPTGGLVKKFTFCAQTSSTCVKSPSTSPPEGLSPFPLGGAVLPLGG